MKIKVAIVEDEPAVTRNLTYLLEDAEPEIEILVRLESVKQAAEWLSKNVSKCNLLFMDIRLSDGLSFEIFDKAKVQVPVIFVTAYNEYALKAFKANGIDYILKPFSEEDIAAALHKYKTIMQTSSPITDYSSLLHAIQNMQTAGAYKTSLLVYNKDKLIPVTIKDVHFFYSKNEALQAYLLSADYPVEGTLEKMYSELNPQNFFRANRQFIISRAAIKEVHYYFNGRLLVKMFSNTPEQILISKAKTGEFKKWMNN